MDSDPQPNPRAFCARASLRRRTLLRGLAGGALGLAVPGCAGTAADPELREILRAAAAPNAPASLDGRLTDASLDGRLTDASLDGRLTDASLAGSYNNFVEFGDGKGIASRAGALGLPGWTLEVAGLARRRGRLPLLELLRRFPHERSVTRLRCVEAWSVTLPWTGFPLRRLIDWIEPLEGARYVRFESFVSYTRAPGQLARFWLPWPYTEALRLDEARHELCLLATGVYGEPLPPQHGAPIRLVVPWKYGFKSIKSITRIELTAERPATFWNSIAPDEYGFEANVDPDVAHPRWSQATELRLGYARRHRTLRYNGYDVAALYDS